MSEEKLMRKHMEERLGKLVNFSLTPPLPECLNIELNNTCNQRCVFCPFHGLYAPKKLKPAILNVNFVKELLKQAAEIGIGKKEVGFYLAGEAFLYKELVEIVQYAKENGFTYVFLTTNGALATHDKMRAIIDAGLDSIRFSINAPDAVRYKEIHGRDDFDIVVDNIKYMRQYLTEENIQIATSISCVITKKTFGIQDEMKKLFSPYVDDIMFIPVMLKRLSNMKEVKEKYEVINDDDVVVNLDFKCPILFNTMYINALGQVVPCCDAYDEDVYFADLKADSDLVKAWNSEGYTRYRRIFTDNDSDKDTICETCTLRMKTVKRFTMD